MACDWLNLLFNHYSSLRGCFIVTQFLHNSLKNGFYLYPLTENAPWNSTLTLWSPNTSHLISIFSDHKVARKAWAWKSCVSIPKVSLHVCVNLGNFSGSPWHDWALCIPRIENCNCLIPRIPAFGLLGSQYMLDVPYKFIFIKLIKKLQNSYYQNSDCFPIITI